MIVRRLRCFFITSVRGKSFPEVAVFVSSDWFKVMCRASIQVLWLNFLPAERHGWAEDYRRFMSLAGNADAVGVELKQGIGDRFH
jgi:hypothetical protein